MLLFKSTLAAGVILYLWGTISWMLLPWHEAALLPFRHESEVTAAVVQNVDRSGMYLLPHKPAAPADPKKAEEAVMEQMKTGPMVIASVRVGPMGSMGGMFVIQFLIMLATAFLGCRLLAEAGSLSYRARVGFCASIGLTIAVAGHLPSWNWWSFSSLYIGVEMMDAIVGWTLAGLMVGRWLPEPLHK